MDDYDENLPFYRELRSAQVSSHYMMPKISKYDGRGDLENTRTLTDHILEKICCEQGRRGFYPAPPIYEATTWESLKSFLSYFTDEITYCIQVTDHEALLALREV